MNAHALHGVQGAGKDWEVWLPAAAVAAACVSNE